MSKRNIGNSGLGAEEILRNLLAIELWRSGLSQAEIGKRLGVATGTVNKMLKGVKREIGVVIVE